MTLRLVRNLVAGVTSPAAMERKLISIVTPCYREELNVPVHFDRILKTIEPYRAKYDFEHIYTDNCSSDRTFEKLLELSNSHPNVRVLRFSRNIGANRAIYQGIIHAKGDAVILVQADLQDPPELISDFVKYWEEGFDVVYGQILDREENWLLKRMRRLYYNLVSSLAEVQPPRNAGEFRLMSKRVVDAVKLYREDDIYLRGVIAHVGFGQKAIPYRRAPRERGRTSTNLLFLIGYGLNGLTSTTVAPLRAVTVVGMFFAAISFLIGLFTAGYKILFPAFIPHGVTTLATLVTFFAGIQILALGIIGEYIRKIYVQSLERPQAIIQDKVNF